VPDWRHRAWQEVSALFLRPNCPLCQRPAQRALCWGCWRQLQACRLPQPAARWASPLPVFAWGHYTGALKRVIAALKYEGARSLAAPLGEALAQSWQDQSPQAGAGDLTVVPVPMHARKRRQRGFDQAELLARSFYRASGLPLQASGLQRAEATAPQFGLRREERARNLEGSFALGIRWHRHPPTGPVLLLDDIYTTGTTARAAAEALRARGIRPCGIVAVALAPPPAV